MTSFQCYEKWTVFNVSKLNNIIFLSVIVVIIQVINFLNAGQRRNSVTINVEKITVSISVIKNLHHSEVIIKPLSQLLIHVLTLVYIFFTQMYYI